MEKQCRKCGQMLPASAFNKHSRSSDGLACYCRPCIQKYERERKAKTQAASSNSQRPKYARPDGYFAQYSQVYEEKHPVRRPVMNAILRAKRAGELTPISELSCVECGGQAQEYHHHDYSKPLEVMPMCRSCHRKWHNENKAIE